MQASRSRAYSRSALTVVACSGTGELSASDVKEAPLALTVDAPLADSWVYVVNDSHSTLISIYCFENLTIQRRCMGIALSGW